MGLCICRLGWKVDTLYIQNTEKTTRGAFLLFSKQLNERTSNAMRANGKNRQQKINKTKLDKYRYFGICTKHSI